MANLSNINNKFLVTTGGDVGIGTTSPNEKLQVAGNIHAYAPSGIDAGLFASTAAGSTTIAVRSSGITHFNGGNVGIGTSSPAQPVHLLNGGFAYMRFTSQGYGATGFDIGQHTNGNIYLNNRDNTSMLFMTNNATAVTINNSQNASFAGIITTETDGSVFGGSGGIPIYARSTGTVSYMQFQTSSTGSNGSSDGLTVGVNGSTAYIWNRENTTLHLGTNDTSALALDNSQNATFAGEILNAMAAPKIRLKPTTQNNASILELGVLNGGTNAYARIDAINLQNFDTNLRFWTNAPGSTTQVERMRITSAGNVGIGKTAPKGSLDVAGAITSGIAQFDPNISLSSNGATPQNGGALEISQAWSVSTSSGDTIVFSHDSVSWKSWILHYNFASTAGLTSGMIGGYWNNSGGQTNVFIVNALGASVVVTHAGQSIIVTFTFTNLGTHPLASFKFMQGGGDGQPLASKTSITINS